MNSIGANIRKFRMFRRMTQVELGEAVGRSKNVVSNWERGDNAPDLDTLEKICQILKVTPNQMFGWEKNQEYEVYRSRLYSYEMQMKELTEKKEKIDQELKALRQRVNEEFDAIDG